MKIINKVKREVMYCKEYGLSCFFIILLSRLFPYETKKNYRWRLLQYKHKVLLNYLTKHFYPVALNSEVKYQQNSQYRECIWTAWLQGEENAPESIRMTLASIRKYSNGHQVIVLTNDIIDRYVEIPQKIKEKHQSGIIENAHYADIIRMMILAKYGGLWLDAKMLLHEPIDETLFSKAFYSIGSPDTKPSRYVSDHKWIVGIIGGSVNSKYLNQISAMLNAYWHKHEIPIDYLAFDYLIAVLYNNDKSFAEIVDALPHMSYYSTSLREMLNTPYNEDMLNSLFVEGQIYIVTYKQNFKKITSNGLDTVYGYLYKKHLNDGELLD